MSLATDFVRAADPASLADAMGLRRLYRWQRDLLRSKHRRMAVVAPRQGGKTLTAALLGLHTALYKPMSTSLILSATERQAREAFRYAVMGYRRLSRPIPAEAENRLSLELENGSRLLVVPATGDTSRGYASDVVIVDEAAFIEDQFFGSIWPSLAVTEGRVLMSSTPNGKRGFFADVFLGTDPAWHRVRVTVEDCPAINREVIEEYRRAHGDELTAQEFYGVFVDSERQAFSTEAIDRAWGKCEAWAL